MLIVIYLYFQVALLFFMVRDLLFCLELGFKIIGIFLICLYIGIKADMFFGTSPIMLLVFLVIAFIMNIGILLRGGKHE